MRSALAEAPRAARARMAVSSSTRIAASDSMQARLRRPERDPERRRHLWQRMAEEVVGDDDRSVRRDRGGASARSTWSRSATAGRRSSTGTLGGGSQLDLDDPAASPRRIIEAGTDGEPVDPGVEPVGVAQPREVPPGVDQRILDRVARELRVPEDEAGGRVQPRDDPAGRARRRRHDRLAPARSTRTRWSTVAHPRRRGSFDRASNSTVPPVPEPFHGRARKRSSQSGSDRLGGPVDLHRDLRVALAGAGRVAPDPPR